MEDLLQYLVDVPCVRITSFFHLRRHRLGFDCFMTGPSYMMLINPLPSYDIPLVRSELTNVDEYLLSISL